MIIVITGPTCMGKSETALKVAEVFDAEIINGDAFQCYKEMNIGVSKPPLEYFSKVKHHFFSFLNVDEDFSIADYQIVLRKTIDEISKRKKNIVIVGGSGLYIRSGLYDYNFQTQEKIDLSKYENLDNEALLKELEKIDPQQAMKIHKNNRKRVLRAIEIYLAQGKTKSELIDSQEHKLLYDAKFFVRSMERDHLYSLINQRVDAMVSSGLVDEVKSIFDKYGDKPHSMQAIGYKELLPYFKGTHTLEDCIEMIKKNSRNYAKRQVTFIKHQFPIIYYKNTEDLLEILGNE